MKRRCICGYSWELNKFDYIRLLFQDITLTCKKCGRKHTYHMTYFVNEKFTKENKQHNKSLVEGKKEISKNG